MIAGLMAGAPAKAGGGCGRGGGSFGFAMIFVLLTFGGWNEAAYLSGEVRDARRNMIRILIGGILALTVIYLLVNVCLPRRAWPRRHEGIQGGRRRCGAARDGATRAPSLIALDRVPCRADHHERRDLHRREDHLRARPGLSRSSASSARGASRAARRPTRCCCRA